MATKKQSTQDTEAKAASPDDSLASAIRESTQQIWQAGLGALNRAQQNSKAAGQWGTLENIFEDRVAQALRRLGIPTAQDVEQLRLRVEELTLAVAALSKKSANSGKSAASAKTPARAPKPASKATAKTPGNATPTTAKTSRASARKPAA